jgi:hypothetical protein
MPSSTRLHLPILSPLNYKEQHLGIILNLKNTLVWKANSVSEEIPVFQLSQTLQNVSKLIHSRTVFIKQSFQLNSFHFSHYVFRHALMRSSLIHTFCTNSMPIYFHMVFFTVCFIRHEIKFFSPLRQNLLHWVFIIISYSACTI